MNRRLYLGVSLATAFMWSTAASAGTLTLAWDRNAETDIAGYRIAYGTTPGSHPTVVDVGNASTFQIRGLADGTKYYLVVMAYNRNGQVSDPSAEIAGNVVGLAGLNSNMESSPTPTGKSVTWTVLNGSAAALEFKWWRYSQLSNAWTLVQDYGPNTSFTWTPQANELGSYAIQVWARVPGSTEDFESWRSTGIFSVANGPIQVGSLESDLALPASQGSPVTWTAKANGGPSPLQYKFWRFDESTGAWAMAKDFSTSNTYTWTPSASDIGRHVVQVWVRGGGSTTDGYEAYRSTGFFDVKNSPISVGQLVASKSMPAGTGDPITWTAVAAGAGPLEYAFYRYSSATQKWTAVQAYSSNKSYTWTPTGTGTFAMAVWVRRQGSAALYDAAGNTPYFQITNSTPSVRSVTSDVGSPVGTDAPVTFAVDATGGPGALQYSFVLYNQARDTWSLVRPYSPSNTFTWVPTMGDGGDYVMAAWVKRPNSTNNYDAYGLTDTFSVGNYPAKALAVATSLDTATAGTPVTITARASGGPGRIEYKFFRYSVNSGIWYVMQDYGWDNTLGWVPSTTDTGPQLFQVWVRRSGSTAPYESFMNLTGSVTIQ